MSGEGPSRQQRRRQIRELAAQGRVVIASGLPNPAPERVLVGVGLAMAEPLARGKPGGASEAAGLAIRLAGGMIDKVAARDQPACAKGCDHCCHFAVSASAPEVLHLARALVAGGAATAGIIERVARRGQDTSGMGVEAVMAAALACPMLSDGVCGAYASRPIVCRQFMSQSADACGAARAGMTVEIPTLRGAINAGALGRNVLLAAVRSRGLDDRCYELVSALQVVLATTDAERRWLAGEDILGRALVVARPAESVAHVERLAATMRAVVGEA